MRISTSQFYESTSATYQNNFSSVVKTQTQIDSGVRIQSAGDDPAGAAQLLLLQQQKDMLGQYSTNMNTIKASLNNQESILDSINTALQKAKNLTIQAGGIISDADRSSIANEIGGIEEQVFSLLNSKDADGNYMFSGSKTSTPPYARNNDGTYTYQGDDIQLNLKVSDTITMAGSDTARSFLEGSPNTGRTQATLLPPAVNDGKVSITAGTVTSTAVYDQGFTAGQPYTLTFTSSTQFTLTDGTGKDITSEIAGNGTFDSTKEGAHSVNLRGVQFDIGMDFSGAEDTVAQDALAKDKAFTLEARPDSFNVSRTPSNDSTAQLTSASIADAKKYSDSFPSSGAVIKFTSDTEYQVFAQPLSANSKPLAEGTMTGTSVTAAGVKFDFSDAPKAGDQFVVSADNHKNQSALDTLSEIRKALLVPTDNDPVAKLKQRDVLSATIGNLSNASEHVDKARGSIGSRLNAIDIQADANTSMGLANDTTMSAIGNTDMASASVDLAFQKAMLEASQLAFVKIAQLSLFNQL